MSAATFFVEFARPTTMNDDRDDTCTCNMIFRPSWTRSNTNVQKLFIYLFNISYLSRLTTPFAYANMNKKHIMYTSPHFLHFLSFYKFFSCRENSRNSAGHFFFLLC